MVLGQPTPGAGMVSATGATGVTGPKREYGITGSFDRDALDKRLADTRARVDAMLTNTGTTSIQERLAAGRESTKGRLEDLNKMYSSPMALEAERDALNPRFDPYDATRRNRQMSDYESMLQENRNAYDQRTSALTNPERPSLSSLGARYGATAKFGHKPYEQAKAAGYSDDEILSYLNENPATRGNDLYQELLSGNVDFNNITSNADRGPQGFRNILNSIM
jgi:hypothetical protein